MYLLVTQKEILRKRIKPFINLFLKFKELRQQLNEESLYSKNDFSFFQYTYSASNEFMIIGEAFLINFAIDIVADNDVFLTLSTYLRIKCIGYDMAEYLIHIDDVEEESKLKEKDYKHINEVLSSIEVELEKFIQTYRLE